MTSIFFRFVGWCSGKLARVFAFKAAPLALIVMTFVATPLRATSADSRRIRLTCVTPGPTTSILVGPQDRGSDPSGEAPPSPTLDVRVIHHNGVKFMPIHKGIITPNDIPTLTKKANQLAPLGTVWNLQWDASSCKSRAPGLFECWRGIQTTINGVKVQPFALHTSKISTTGIAGTFEKLAVNMLLTVDGESHYLTMEYDPEECLL